MTDADNQREAIDDQAIDQDLPDSPQADSAESGSQDADQATSSQHDDDHQPAVADAASQPSAPKGGGKTAAAPAVESEEGRMDWYILKVAFNREESIRDALAKRVRMEGMEEYFGDIVVPTEDLVEFTRAGKRRIVKRKLLPGYLMVNMIINDDTWFLVRETGGISDFTGAAGKPMPMDPADIERFVKKPEIGEDDEVQLKTSIPFDVGDRVRVKEGNFQNQEGEIDSVDEANGRITVIINIFGRSVPMELDHWQVEEL
ncbi:transcription termination/antitermination protein NusG [Planctomycetaceae bacterium SH139]